MDVVKTKIQGVGVTEKDARARLRWSQMSRCGSL